MRHAIALLVLAAACGDDDARVTFDARPLADARPAVDAPLADAPLAASDAPPLPDAPPATEPDAAAATIDAAVNTPPVITSITWSAPTSCVHGTAGSFTFAIVVSDAESPVGSLVLSGGAAGCQGTLDETEDMLTCPNLNPYSGSLTVTDPQGATDMLSFVIMPCTNGTAP
jgi:hypothetical protein